MEKGLNQVWELESLLEADRESAGPRYGSFYAVQERAQLEFITPNRLASLHRSAPEAQP